MSHELRTPLNAIGGYAELMELGIRGPVTAEQRADLARIQAAQRHLIGLVTDVLNFARVEGGHVHYALADLPAAEALVVLEGLVGPQFGTKGVTYSAAPCDPALRVRADRDRLQQVLLNLVTNALKFTEPGGRVEVACGAAPGGGSVAFHVRDTGIGIPADKLGTIFEPFVQVNQRLTRPQEGVGLGLAISRDLARGMGGDLTAESTFGAGSTFTLTLPAAGQE
jgi:signal transduction histidine kinase